MRPDRRLGAAGNHVGNARIQVQIIALCAAAAVGHLSTYGRWASGPC